MKKSAKVYRYKFDPVTKLYNGLTYDLKEKHATDVQPNFESGFKTIYDLELKGWKLIDQREYYELMAHINKQLEFETDIKNYIGQALLHLGEDIHKFQDRFDINNADRFIALKELYFTNDSKSTAIHRDLKHVEKLVEYGNNQEIKHRVDLATQITGLAEQTQILLRAVNNLNTQVTHIKFEMELSWFNKLLRWFF